MEVSEFIRFTLDQPNDQKSKQKYTADVQFVNLFLADQREKGFLKLKEEIEAKQKKCRAVVCGGDGTVMWVVEEMIKYKLDVEHCPIGIVPFGTGNDFARVLGWGGSAPGQVIGSNLGGLKKMIKKWIFSTIADFDIWDIQVEVDQNVGEFRQVKKVNGKVEKNPILEKDAQGVPIQGKVLKKFSKHMSNYCSVGVDARIGYGFDKNRKKSQIGNKCVYAWEGLKKCFIRTPKMSDIIKNLEFQNNSMIGLQQDGKVQLLKNNNVQSSEKQTQIQSPPVSQQLEQGIVKNSGIGIDFPSSNMNLNNGSSQCFQTRPNDRDSQKIFKQQNSTSEIPLLKGNPVCLICSNIPSYAGGINLWKGCQNKLGISYVDEKKKMIDKFENQNFGDGQLEFMSFSSSFSMSMEQVISGNSQRVAQGKGPFYLNFKDKDEKGRNVITYFQVDGEFYQAKAPKYIKFQLAYELPNGKIKIMVENSSQKV
ncbi:ATP-NAD kinase-like domain [Pseudocohnilembus persalinus]|uniref:Diacylglycerol kinase n=1 Tax=Pseudocohnilembus persalinus TaxID=266149 RepID=A0A0V0R658_PSEPJ|nr:ATP-NAD kinase-like domain [Pseudocohnilembus persalinus]|eukprot:KRX09840.1 ATP-NAD kinase-like domain [Pseudocohnilembus persalinus]